MGGGSGGGGGDSKYDNLEKLYEEQTKNAQMLRELSQQYLPGAMENYMGQVNTVQDPNYAASQANIAAADMAKANAMERDAVTRQLTSSGVNANDPRFAGSLRNTELSNAARMAAGVNSTRDAAGRYQLAVAQDALGTMTGTNNSAASQMGSATSGLSSLYTNQQNMQAQQEANRSQNTANAVAGAYSLLMKDGGRVRGLELLAGGGLTGGAAFAPLTPPMARTVQAPQQPGASPTAAVQIGKQAFGGEGLSGIADRMAAKGQGLMDKAGSIADTLGADNTARQIHGYAKTMNLSPDQAKAAYDANQAAMVEAMEAGDSASAAQFAARGQGMASGAGLDAAGASGAGEAGTAMAGEAANVAGGTAAANAGLMESAGVAGSAAGEAGAGLAAAGEAGAGLAAAEGAAGASAMTGALGAASAAMPWVGAAVALGSALGLFSEGGKVKDLREKGGDVPGQWTENKDIVPALLVPEEHVINAEASALAGHDRLEALNRKGLQLRQQGKTPQKIRRGLEALR
ncbi:MAG: hypothetical protein LBR95_06990 [Azoarcus sp.]|jgi:hypothetical protein|nr:hypothetical protein [Azoarcus sp.]